MTSTERQSVCIYRGQIGPHFQERYTCVVSGGSLKTTTVSSMHTPNMYIQYIHTGIYIYAPIE